MSAHLHVGMKVVCIKEGAWTNAFPEEKLPVFRGVYTIRSIEMEGGEVSLRFEELDNSDLAREFDIEECKFWSIRFRPVQVRKTSIEVFKRLLTPSDDDKHLIEVFDFVSMQGDLQ